MMRRLLVAALGATPLLAGPVHAVPAPQLVDARDDWIAPQDILWGRLSSTRVRGVPHLRAELRLAAAPVPDGPTTYRFAFADRAHCIRYVVVYEWRGVNTISPATLDTEKGCTPRTSVGGNVLEPAPVGFAVKGSTLTFTIPYVNNLHEGIRLSRLSATACTSVCGVVGETSTTAFGDWADTNRAAYVVGSDLPRR